MEEVVQHADEGEVLVCRKSLHTVQEKDESWLCENIFHPRCTSQNQVCNVISDSGSYANLVAEEMVKKLNLDTKLYPQPQKILWFQKGSRFKVTKQCLVSFSIRKTYKDEQRGTNGCMSFTTW